MKKAKPHLRLATRDSKLALWQAHFVQKQLKKQGLSSELVLVKSQGDLQQKQPVHALNTVGLFTKAIDEAVLDGRADAGVHSLKDLPTELHKDLKIGCVLKREDARDVLVYKEKDFLKRLDQQATIATGSTRRRAQWLHKYPNHTMVGIRGNVDTRMQKLRDSDWDGMILAAAGLKRLKIKALTKKLAWMVSAPGQGAVVVVSRKKDKAANTVLSRLSHKETNQAVVAERTFLDAIGAGCTAPVGAYATVKHRNLTLKAEILSADGKERIAVELIDKLENAARLGRRVAREAARRGAGKLLKG